MMYVSCDPVRAEEVGIVTRDCRKTAGGLAVVTDRAVMGCAGLEGTLEERAEALGGGVMDCATAMATVVVTINDERQTIKDER